MTLHQTSSDPSNVTPAPLGRAKQLAATLLSERGEASGALLARQLHETLRGLDTDERHGFQRYLATDFQPDQTALRAVAGDTEFGKRQSTEVTAGLRRRGIVMFPADLGIDEKAATRDWLAAKSIDELVTASGGLYAPPAKFRRTAVAAE